jgi:hypothetical protein
VSIGDLQKLSPTPCLQNLSATLCTVLGAWDAVQQTEVWHVAHAMVRNSWLGGTVKGGYCLCCSPAVGSWGQCSKHKLCRWHMALSHIALTRSYCLLLLLAAYSFKKVQTMIVAVVAGTLFLRGTIETNTIQSGTLYLGLIFLSIVSALPCALPGFW